MSRKKQNLLTKGLTSELYLFAYLEPNNIRQLARKLQNTSGNPTNYSKASPAIHDLTISKYLKHDKKDEKYHINLEKLVEELEIIIKSKNEALNDEEKKYLIRILKENEFFKLLSADIIKKIQEQMKGKHEINALDVFCERIGAMSAAMLLQKKVNPKINESFLSIQKGNFEEVNEKMTEFQTFMDDMMAQIEPEFIKKVQEVPLGQIFLERIWPFMRKISSGMIFFVITEETLDKFSKLWSGYEGVRLALDTFSVYEKK